METQTELTPEQQQQADQEAFQKGLSSVRGNTAPTEKPVEKAVVTEAKEEPAEQKAEEAKEVDPWEGVPKVVRERLEAQEAERQKLVSRLRTAEGHIGNLTSQLKEARAAKATTEARGQDAPTKEQVERASQDEARWKQLREDFPDWAEAIDSRLKAMEARQTPSVDTSQIEARLKADFEKQVSAAAAKARDESDQQMEVLLPIYLKYPTWKKTIVSAEYDAWIKKQPLEVRQLEQSADPQDAISLLDKYADFQKKAAEKLERKERLEKAANAPKATVVTPDTTESAEAAYLRGLRKVRGG